MADDFAGFLGEISTETISDINDVSAEESLWLTGRGPTPSGAHCSVIVAALLSL